MPGVPGLEHLQWMKLRRYRPKQYNCDKRGQYSHLSDCAGLVVAGRRSVNPVHHLPEGSLTLVSHRLENAEDEMTEAGRV